MNAERWQQLEREGGVMDLSARAKWLLRGEDRIRFLNGQVTQDIRKVRSDRALRACVTDVKGRVIGDVQVRAVEEVQGLLLDAEVELRETLGMRLERYIVADDVEIEDVTEAWGLMHVFGAAANADRPLGAVDSNRLRTSGYDLWLPGSGAGAATVGAEEWEMLRVLRGIARYPNELSGGVFPPEAGLEEETMDYAKGCYIGQEVLSRIRSSGKMPRTLVKWSGLRSSVEAGVSLRLPGSEASVGQVTSVIQHPGTGRVCGLAFVKQGAVPADSRLLVGDELASIHALNQDFPTF